MSIYLMGYMGSGKSTVGRLLARAIEFTYIDLDDYIATQEGMTIPEIFKIKGEIYFRRKEAYYLKQVLDNDQGDLVCSLGGGTPCYGNNLEVLKSYNVNTVYLNVPVADLTERIWDARDERPLVAGFTEKKDLEEYVRKHLFERAFYYNQASIIKKVGDLYPSQIVEDVVQTIQQ